MVKNQNPLEITKTDMESNHLIVYINWKLLLMKDRSVGKTKTFLLSDCFNSADEDIQYNEDEPSNSQVEKLKHYWQQR